ncbi:Hypothetical_protein [Hexamita inflata]|uniref:Hypothetical_protein n=1 Tax=Hexamita inflata TaxID=28002 RepID=A0AA86N7I5_9EUKA|nr:Hypothetical protein HINF_LOCUS1972 [Hexamita inflata]
MDIFVQISNQKSYQYKRVCNLFDQSHGAQNQLGQKRRKNQKEVNDIITNHYLIQMRVFKPEQSDPRTGCTLCNGIARHRCSCNLGMCMTCYTRHCLEQQIRLSQKEVEK